MEATKHKGLNFPVERGVGIIEIRIDSLGRFFNTLDPSPFHSRDIDDDAEKYIVDSVRMFQLSEKLKLRFVLPQKEHLDAVEILPHALDNFFGFRAAMAGMELRAILLEGRMAMLLGLVFLGACISLRFMLGFLSGSPAGNVLLEGLSITGWVAMWKPVQIFLYDWWPVFRKKKIYEKISNLTIEIVIE